MRTSLVILAVAFGCAGCREDQTSTRESVPAVPLSDRGERPSFYDSNNIEEYYGRCPMCQRWVKGGLTHLSWSDATGKPRGAGFFVTGLCEHCNASLIVDEQGRPTNVSRVIQWRAPR